MRWKLVTSVVVAMCCISLALVHADDDDPVFMRWLVPGNPGDDAIRIYWQQSRQGELDADGEIDLGTMLFYRGYPDDAIDAFKRAAKLAPEMPEPWFRIGLVNHRRHEVRLARRAYGRCLDRRPGHGWCNFYRGLLEEQQGNATEALELYRTAYRHAPELADPTVNPEVLYSKLQLGATLEGASGDRFMVNAPLAYMDPRRVRKARDGVVPPSPADKRTPGAAGRDTSVSDGEDAAPSDGASVSPQSTAPGATRRITPPAATPAPTETPAAAPKADEIPSYLHIRSTSPDALLRPTWWPDPARRYLS